jgi:hypothetical protein
MRSAKIWTVLSLSIATAGLVACTGEIGQPKQNAGGGSAGIPGVTAGTAGIGGGSAGAPVNCEDTSTIKAPLRRLTRFEYNNTVRDLVGVTDAPANLFPPEEVGSGFGTDAKAQTTSFDLIEKYMTTGRSMAEALTAPGRIAELGACAVAPAAADEATCARSVIDTFVPKVFRRPLEPGDAESLSQLFQTVRTGGATFASSLAAVLEAAFQSPEFLYRPELGKPAADGSALRQPTDYEMASRLSYLFYGSQPDAELLAAAAAGQLSTREGVRLQAERMLTDMKYRDKARDVVRYFFDSLLPIQALGSLTRTKDYGGFTQEVGHLLRQETQTFVQDQVFNGGTWPGALTAPHTFLNQRLAEYYGIPGVTGTEFQKVPLDGIKRSGLLTQAGVVSGPIHSDPNNPVVRGVFVLTKLMCQTVLSPPPSLGTITPPDPNIGGTARDRYTAHSQDIKCAGCHQSIDPIGFALENFTSVGQWQDTENGKTIDVSVTSPQLGTFTGAVELGKKMAESVQVQECFATNWANFAYGLGSDEQDSCTMAQLKTQFQAKGYNIKELLLELSQTRSFLYMPAVQP